MNIDETLIQKCKQELFDAQGKIDRAHIILNTMFADHAADDGKIDSEERAEITAHKSEESTGTSTNTGSPKFPTLIELCESVERSYIGVLSDRERLVVNRVRDIIGRQLRASA